jgi:cysteinyl-tRNA synthetase
MYKTFNQVLSIMIFDFIEDEIPSDILEKFEQRNTAKQEKDFQKADDLRNELLTL